MTRRFVLDINLKTLLMGLLPQFSLFPHEREGSVDAEPTALGWNMFARLLRQRARTIAAATSQEEANARSICELARCLNLRDRTIKEALQSMKKDGYHPNFKDLTSWPDSQATLILLERGDVIPVHDHAGLLGVALGLDGQLQVKRYELAYGDPASGRCLLKLVDDGILSRGQTSFVTPTRLNIHGLRALSNSAVLDIFVPAYDASRSLLTHSYVLTKAATGKEYFLATTCC
jgi:hypothetical protein